MATPDSSTYTGWFNNKEDSRLDFYYAGTRVGHLNASGFSLANSGVTDSVIQNAGLTAALKTQVVVLGTTAAVASDGAGAILPDIGWVAPAAIRVLSAWRVNQTASDVTKGTATTQLSYRRVNLIANTAAAGSGTTIVASQNATASAASKVSRAFAVVAALTVPAGGIIQASHLTVGADTADGTDMAASLFQMAYELV